MCLHAKAPHKALASSDAGDIVVECVVVEEVSFLRSPARVADHAGRSPGQRDRAVARILEPAQRDQPDQVADMEAVCSRVAPVVDRHLPVGDLRPEDSRSVESWMRLRASRSAIRSIREWRVLSPRGRPVGRFRARSPVPGVGGDHLEAGPAVPHSVGRDRRRSESRPAPPTRPGGTTAARAAVRLHALPAARRARQRTRPVVSEPHRRPPIAGRPGLVPAFARFVDDHEEALVDLLATQKTQTNEVGRCGSFLPALALLADEMGPLGHLDVGASGGSTSCWTSTSTTTPTSRSTAATGRSRRRRPVGRGAPDHHSWRGAAARPGYRRSDPTRRRSRSDRCHRSRLRRDGWRRASGRTRPIGSIDSAPRSPSPPPRRPRSAGRCGRIVGRRDRRGRSTVAIRW